MPSCAAACIADSAMATCPTYQLLGSELDGPRGRIYLIKEMLETRQASGKTRLHLDRCLTCRSCETTCPSGVRYGRLIDIGRETVEQLAPRSLAERLVRKAMLAVIPLHRAHVHCAVIGAHVPSAAAGSSSGKRYRPDRHSCGDAGIISRTAHAGAGWLRPAAGHAEHQCSGGARARPARHLAAQRSRVPVAAAR